MLTFLSMEVSPSEAVMPSGVEITLPSAFTHSRTGSVHPYVTYAISVVPPRVSVLFSGSTILIYGSYIFLPI